MSHYSVEDERYPESPNLTRVVIYEFVMYFKPTPEINGYTVISETHFNYGGTIPITMVAAKACPKSV